MFYISCLTYVELGFIRSKEKDSKVQELSGTHEFFVNTHMILYQFTFNNHIMYGNHRLSKKTSISLRTFTLSFMEITVREVYSTVVRYQSLVSKTDTRYLDGLCMWFETCYYGVFRFHTDIQICTKVVIN